MTRRRCCATILGKDRAQAVREANHHETRKQTGEAEKQERRADEPRGEAHAKEAHPKDDHTNHRAKDDADDPHYDAAIRQPECLEYLTSRVQKVEIAGAGAAAGAPCA